MARQDSLLDRFPLLGSFGGGRPLLVFQRPPDSLWVFRSDGHWDSPIYPRGGYEDEEDNLPAIKAWFAYHMVLYARMIRHLDAYAKVGDDPNRNEGGAVWDAFRLVDYLKSRGYCTPPAPPRPIREYKHCLDDLQAVVVQLRKVRKWVGEAATVKAPSGTSAEELAGRGRGEAVWKPSLVWLAQAMFLVRDHPDWSDAKIARQVGRDPSRLSRSREYQAAAAMARGTKTDRQKGHVTVDPETRLRDVEAYKLDDPAEINWDDH